ncbi:MAG: 16S rRNA (cytosine(1402)-N(4))-methyltransferase RsmH [bacterium]
MEFKHVSVLLNETISSLNIKPTGVYVDGTLGGGGHAVEICKRLSSSGKFIGIDQDKEAIEASTYRLREFKNVISIHQSNYQEMIDIVHSLGFDGVDGIVLDLGVSSYQIDKVERGFSYRSDAPLDMRMDQRQGKTAKEIVNNYKEDKLKKILYDYGEEKYSRSIARNILIARENSPIETTGQLVEIIKRSMPTKALYSGGHPAKKTFQALRIELNKELEVLQTSLNNMIGLLNDRGRISIITFHSLEDRIVKKIFRDNQNPCTCPREFPICVCNKKPKGKVITRKPIQPKDEEIKNNKRAKSAKLRVFEREKV